MLFASSQTTSTGASMTISLSVCADMVCLLLPGGGSRLFTGGANRLFPGGAKRLVSSGAKRLVPGGAKRQGAKRGLVDLPDRGDWQFVEDPHPGGKLVWRHAERGQVRPQVLEAERPRGALSLRRLRGAVLSLRRLRGAVLSLR